MRRAGWIAVGSFLAIATALAIAPLIWWALVTPSDLARSESTPPYLDLHVHVAGLGYGQSGIFLSEDLLDSYKARYYFNAFGVSREQLQREGDRIVIERLSLMIEESREVAAAVVLALDGVVDEHGAMDWNRTQIYVPNEFLARELPKYPNLHFGASIHPNRRDAIDRLHQVSDQGAVLIKWLPNIMQIEPSDPRNREFYATMRDLDLPLLSHTGMERAFMSADNALGDPRKLELPLSMGVTVIAAHLASTGSINGESQFERLVDMFGEFPNLYADVSSLTQVNKIGYLKEALRRPQVPERLLYGSDWPLQNFPVVSPFYHLGTISMADAKRVQRTANAWDRDVYLKRAMGVDESIFRRAEQILNLPFRNSQRSRNQVQEKP